MGNCFMATVLDLIGETPLIEATQFDRGPCRLFLKLESANPSGSIKDRPARAMIEAAEANGRLRPGGTIVEATAGNTGLGLALVGARKGYRIVLIVPDKMAREKILHCKAMGAEVMTPTNPMLKVVDLQHIAAIARERRILTACDNTFASPWTQRPLEHGFDLVMHSTTKYLNGHSDMVGGMVIVGDNAELRERMAFLQNAVGAIQGPFDSFLALRGIKTLDLRMERQSASALRIARWLAQHPRIERVFYPGLASHPQHELARRQMRAFGAMIAVEVAGSLDDARGFLERCRLFTLAESLGGVESLISLPALMTHASTPLQVRAALGITDRLVRISVGVEDGDDLIADLDAALGGQ
jgi:cystathionine beta-lyase/cystathionine gamma-synthase